MANKVTGKSAQGTGVNIYRLKTGKRAPVSSEAMKKTSGGKKKKVVQSKPPESGGPSMIANPTPPSAEPRKMSDEKIDPKVPDDGKSKKLANVNYNRTSGIRKRKDPPPDTFQEADDMMLDLADLFKVENKKLRKEVAFLEEAINEKTKDNIKMKVESENQKKMISSLTDLVSDLKEEIYKNTSSKVTKPNGDLKQGQKSKAGDYFANKLNLEPLPQPDSIFRKRAGTKKSPGKSGIRKFLFQTPKKCGSGNARKLKENLNQTPCIPFDDSKSEDSFLDSSYCSVSKMTGAHKYKRVEEEFPVPRVKFAIVTEEKDGAGREIARLPCAMRPETLIRQVKKSYCKKMGLDRDKMELKMTGSFDVNQNMIILLNENSVNGLEGAVVKVVRVGDKGPKDSKEMDVRYSCESDV